MKYILVTIILLSILESAAQTCNVNLTEQEEKYFKTVKQTVAYLKSKKTTPLSFHETQHYSKEEAIYDSVIERFFEKEKLLKNLSTDASHFAVEGKLDILRHILNICDYYLDIVPPDSIFVRPYRFKPETAPINDEEDRKELNNMFEVYFLINSKELTVLACHFDSLTAKLLMLSPYSDPNADYLYDFLRRQKNYYEFPNPDKSKDLNQ